ncbi:hypothetical protein HMPREF3034_00155 [Prevotella sp. DNF00663]|nr:hypothetical protein HMPREF3034_00155 [Prevotella sp. DNF00663]
MLCQNDDNDLLQRLRSIAATTFQQACQAFSVVLFRPCSNWLI